MIEPTAEERAALALERAKLGPNAEGLIQAVENFLAATSSPDAARAVMAGQSDAAGPSLASHFGRGPAHPELRATG
jgi:hypothetical protein